MLSGTFFPARTAFLPCSVIRWQYGGWAENHLTDIVFRTVEDSASRQMLGPLCLAIA